MLSSATYIKVGVELVIYTTYVHPDSTINYTPNFIVEIPANSYVADECTDTCRTMRNADANHGSCRKFDAESSSGQADLYHFPDAISSVMQYFLCILPVRLI